MDVFDSIDAGKNIIKKISIQLHNDTMRVISYGKNNRPLKDISLALKGRNNGSLFALVKASDNARLDLLRD